MTTVYHSKIDNWLLVVLASAIAVSLYASIQLISTEPPSAWWPLLLTLGLGVVLPLWLLLGTRYILQPEQLIIRSGPFKWVVPVAEITHLSSTKNPLSSPALSLDRLRIDYSRGKFIMISPRDKERFIQDMENLRRDTR